MSNIKDVPWCLMRYWREPGSLSWCPILGQWAQPGTQQVPSEHRTHFLTGRVIELQVHIFSLFYKQGWQASSHVVFTSTCSELMKVPLFSAGLEYSAYLKKTNTNAYSQWRTFLSNLFLFILQSADPRGHIQN